MEDLRFDEPMRVAPAVPPSRYRMLARAELSIVWIAGADGCRAGWFRACLELETGAQHFAICATAEDLLATPPAPSILAIDIPIGLADRGTRACDVAARKRLGVRRASVFPPPLRPALGAATQAEASRLTREIDGKGVGAQAFGIWAKIREVDQWLASSTPAVRAAVYEAHPELCFMGWAGGCPMAHGKKTTEGRRERLQVAEAWLGNGVLERARAGPTKARVADDDILDAVATLWAARRISEGAHVTLGDGAIDAAGLPMRICY
jgi:predicted RNase H-like nuclease